MMNYCRIDLDTTGQEHHPSAPPLPYNPAYTSTQNLMASSYPQQSHPVPLREGPGILNVPPMMYSVPGGVHAQPPISLHPPTAALKPMPHPPPAPSLNEVILNEDRQRVRCPYCYASVLTKVNYITGKMTHIVAVAALFTCCPFFWVPYVIECCKDVDHACPNCARSIGRYRRFI